MAGEIYVSVSLFFFSTHEKPYASGGNTTMSNLALRWNVTDATSAMTGSVVWPMNHSSIRNPRLKSRDSQGVMGHQKHHPFFIFAENSHLAHFFPSSRFCNQLVCCWISPPIASLITTSHCNLPVVSWFWKTGRAPENGWKEWSLKRMVQLLDLKLVYPDEGIHSRVMYKSMLYWYYWYIHNLWIPYYRPYPYLWLVLYNFCCEITQSWSFRVGLNAFFSAATGFL